MERPGDVPTYSVRESKKARRVTLKIFPDCSLEIIIPRGFDLRNIPRIVEEKGEWIQRVFRKLEDTRKKSNESSSLESLPESIYLKAMGKSYRVIYSNRPTENLGLIESDECELTLIGRSTDYEAGRHRLQCWLRQKARSFLFQLLEETSGQTGLSFRKIQIRGQKSRWGSCSSNGTISLNFKLLFLPHELVSYIMVHELCHTVHLNHSREFWSLVQGLEPGFKKLRAEMKTASLYVPPWAC